MHHLSMVLTVIRLFFVRKFMEVIYWIAGLGILCLILDLVKHITDDREQDEIYSAISKINNPKAFEKSKDDPNK